MSVESVHLCKKSWLPFCIYFKSTKIIEIVSYVALVSFGSTNSFSSDLLLSVKTCISSSEGLLWIQWLYYAVNSWHHMLESVWSIRTEADGSKRWSEWKCGSLLCVNVDQVIGVLCFRVHCTLTVSCSFKRFRELSYCFALWRESGAGDTQRTDLSGLQRDQCDSWSDPVNLSEVDETVGRRTGV